MKSDNQVWYTITRTINTGNYQSIKFDVGESRSVGKDEDSEVTYKGLRKDVNARMSEIMKKLKIGDD